MTVKMAKDLLAKNGGKPILPGSLEMKALMLVASKCGSNKS